MRSARVTWLSWDLRPCPLTPGPCWGQRGSRSRDLCVLFTAHPWGPVQCQTHSRCSVSAW